MIPLPHLDETLPPSMGVVSYGAVGGARAAEHLRLLAWSAALAPLRAGANAA